MNLGILIRNDFIPILELILEEEISHVSFGVKWYKYFCKINNLNAQKEYKKFIENQKVQIICPNTEARLKAGFDFF